MAGAGAFRWREIVRSFCVLAKFVHIHTPEVALLIFLLFREYGLLISIVPEQQGVVTNYKRNYH